MHKKLRSVLLTQAMVRICYVLLAAAVIALPFICKYSYSEIKDMVPSLGKYVMGPFYAIVPAGYFALVCIDKLTANIKKDIVFDMKNVKLLSELSIMCFYASAVCVISFLIIWFTASEDISLGLVILAAGSLFMGLIVRVVKNIFESAIIIKNENDLTI